MTPINWIISRLKEPSTWAGFSGLAIALGLTDSEWSAIAAAAAAVFGAVAVVAHERGGA